MSKKGSTDFYQTYVIFMRLSAVSFEIKRLKADHSILQWQPIHEKQRNNEDFVLTHQNDDYDVMVSN